jgi:hypothetical protein
MKVLLRLLPNIKDMNFAEKDISLSMSRIFNKTVSLEDIEKIDQEEMILNWFKSSYKQSAINPFRLFQYLAKPNKSILILIKALIYGLMTKFSELKTKYTKK